MRKGEYLERAVVIPGADVAIEGLYHRGPKRPPLLIAPEHPSRGSMETTIVAELAWAVTRAGHATLRFNYRGVGASGGVFGGDAAALIDARLAIDHLRQSAAASEVALAGVGYGGAVVARAAIASDIPPPILILIAPLLDALPVEALEALDTEVVLIAAGEEDPAVRDALRAIAGRLRQGRLAVIPHADRAFVRGLSDLGRVVQEAIAPPGMIDLG